MAGSAPAWPRFMRRSSLASTFWAASGCIWDQFYLIFALYLPIQLKQIFIHNSIFLYNPIQSYMWSHTPTNLQTRKSKIISFYKGSSKWLRLHNLPSLSSRYPIHDSPLAGGDPAPWKRENFETLSAGKMWPKEWHSFIFFASDPLFDFLILTFDGITCKEQVPKACVGISVAALPIQDCCQCWGPHSATLEL